VSDGPHSKAKGRGRALLAWGGTALLLAYMGWTTDFRTAWQAFTGADHLVFVVTMVVATVVTYLTDVVTVRLLLRWVGFRVGFREFARVKGVSYLLNIVNYNLALVMMAAVVKRRMQRNWGAAGSPFLLLNFIDLMVFATLALAAIAAGASPFDPEPTLFVAAFSAAAFLGAPTLCLVARLRGRLPGFLGRVAGHDLLAAFRDLSAAHLLAALGLRSLLILEYAAMNWAFLQAFGTDVPIGRLLVFMPILSLIAFIPISVAGLGSTQVVMRGFYGPYVPDAIAATQAARAAVIDAYSTSTIVSVYVLRVLIGLAFLPWVQRYLAAAGEGIGDEPDATRASPG
jgi:uncharacterized membrane protein YbhN (UPF0104 family)